jgi:glycosyltransferase involved in cell wall biosynthesis
MTASLKGARVAFIILQGHNIFSPESNNKAGGAELQAFRVGKMLSQDHGCRVRFLTLGPRDGVGEFEGMELATISRSRGPLGKLQGMFRALEEFKPAVVMQRCWGLETWAAARHARLHGARFIFMIASPLDIQPHQPWHWLNWRRALYRLGIYQADAIVAQSQDQMGQIEAGLRQRAVLIRGLQPPPEPRDAPGEGVLWVGKSLPVKRPDLLLDLAERLPRLRFTMIMNPAPPEREYERLRARARSLTNVEHIPYVPYGEIIEYFRRARVFVSTSDPMESFPNTFLQSFRVGLPVMSLGRDPDGIIEKRGLGYYAHDKLDALSAELERRHEDFEWLRECGANGARYLQEEHSPEQTSARWADLVSRQMASNPSR